MNGEQCPPTGRLPAGTLRNGQKRTCHPNLRISLFLEGVSLVMVAADFPEPRLVILRELYLGEELACLPRIEVRDYEADVAMLPGEGLSVKLECKESLVILDVL